MSTFHLLYHIPWTRMLDSTVQQMEPRCLFWVADRESAERKKAKNGVGGELCHQCLFWYPPMFPSVWKFLMAAIWMLDQSMLHKSRNSGRDFWWNHLPCGPVLTPIYCTKLKIHSSTCTQSNKLFVNKFCF